MPTRLLSIAFACLFSMSAQAQLSSDRFSPINYFGRYHGFGYSDGYHACKDGRCSTGSSWKGWSAMSTLSDFPTSPPSNRMVPMRSMVGLPQYSHPTYVEPSFGNAIEIRLQASSFRQKTNLDICHRNSRRSSGIAIIIRGSTTLSRTKAADKEAGDRKKDQN